MNDNERLERVLDEHGELLESEGGDVHIWLWVLDLDDMGIQKLGLVANCQWRVAQLPDDGPTGRWKDEASEPEDAADSLVLEDPSRNPKYVLHHLMGAMKFPLAVFRAKLEERGAEVGLGGLAEQFPFVALVCAAFASQNAGWNGAAAEWAAELPPDARVLASASARRGDLRALPLSEEGRERLEGRLDEVIARHTE